MSPNFNAIKEIISRIDVPIQKETTWTAISWAFSLIFRYGGNLTDLRSDAPFRQFREQLFVLHDVFKSNGLLQFSEFIGVEESIKLFNNKIVDLPINEQYNFGVPAREELCKEIWELLSKTRKLYIAVVDSIDHDNYVDDSGILDRVFFLLHNPIRQELFCYEGEKYNGLVSAMRELKNLFISVKRSTDTLDEIVVLAEDFVKHREELRELGETISQRLGGEYSYWSEKEDVKQPKDASSRMRSLRSILEADGFDDVEVQNQLSNVGLLMKKLTERKREQIDQWEPSLFRKDLAIYFSKIPDFELIILAKLLSAFLDNPENERRMKKIDDVVCDLARLKEHYRSVFRKISDELQRDWEDFRAGGNQYSDGDD